jgi:uncharacterized protein YndB with AHSA1/START domain
MGLGIGPLYMRRSIFIQAPLGRVWKEFESFDRIQQWFGIGHQLHKLDPVVGGEVDISIEGDHGVKPDDDGRTHMVGSVLVVEPGREISFQTRWQYDKETAPNVWTLRASSLYEGTLVEIIEHGMELAGKKAADWLQGIEEGWDIKHLKLLRSIVEK